MKFIELFAGIGGFRYGLEMCNKQQTHKRESVQPNRNISYSSGEQGRDKQQVRFNCVWANEIDKYACETYRKNYGGGELYEGDITTVKTEDIPEHDLLVGGFPCQTFSIAGKRAGFDDTRGTLFFEIARILRDKTPRCVLLENVKGLLSHNSGRTFQTILKVLSDIGYRVEWQVLNSKNFGVPQNRERVFIIGHLRGQSGGQVFPLGETDGLYKEQHAQGKLVNCLDKSYHKGWCDHGQRTMLRTDQPDTQPEGDKPNSPNSIRRASYTDDMRIRRLTPVEAERLQGFPDNWTQKGIDSKGQHVVMSDTQRYKQCGNAVTTNVITAIGRKIYEQDLMSQL